MVIIVLGHSFERLQRFYPANEPLSDFADGVFKVLATPFSGCCIFFCVSGYSLLAYLHNRRTLRLKPAIHIYAIRRLSRLWLPYICILVSTYGFIKLTGYSPKGTNQFAVAPHSLTVSLIASLIFLHDLIFGTFPRLFPPGWFLEAQVQFYAIGPALCVFYLRFEAAQTRLRAGYAMLLLFIAVSVLLDAYGPANTRYSLFAFMPYFWFGAILADLYHNHGYEMVKRSVWGWLPVGWGALAVFILVGMPLEHDVLQMIARLVCLAVIFKVAFVNDNSFHRALANPYLGFVGLACYSIFLVHLQVLQILTPNVTGLFRVMPFGLAIMTCCAITIPPVLLVSLTFYHFVERPCLRAAEWLFNRLSSPQLIAAAQQGGAAAGSNRGN